MTTHLRTMQPGEPVALTLVTPRRVGQEQEELAIARLQDLIEPRSRRRVGSWGTPFALIFLAHALGHRFADSEAECDCACGAAFPSAGPDAADGHLMDVASSALAEQDGLSEAACEFLRESGLNNSHVPLDVSLAAEAVAYQFLDEDYRFYNSSNGGAH